MHCEQAEMLLGQYLFDELESPPRDELEAHLAQCPACSEKLGDMRLTLNMLTDAVAAEPTPALTDDRRTALLRTIDLEEKKAAKRREKRSPREVWQGIAVVFTMRRVSIAAAGFLLAVGVLGIVLPSLSGTRRAARKMASSDSVATAKIEASDYAVTPLDSTVSQGWAERQKSPSRLTYGEDGASNGTFNGRTSGGVAAGDQLALGNTRHWNAPPLPATKAPAVNLFDSTLSTSQSGAALNVEGTVNADKRLATLTPKPSLPPRTTAAPDDNLSSGLQTFEAPALASGGRRGNVLDRRDRIVPASGEPTAEALQDAPIAGKSIALNMTRSREEVGEAALGLNWKKTAQRTTRYDVEKSKFDADGDGVADGRRWGRTNLSGGSDVRFKVEAGIPITGKDNLPAGAGYAAPDIAGAKAPAGNTEQYFYARSGQQSGNGSAAPPEYGQQGQAEVRELPKLMKVQEEEKSAEEFAAKSETDHRALNTFGQIVTDESGIVTGRRSFLGDKTTPANEPDGGLQGTPRPGSGPAPTTGPVPATPGRSGATLSDDLYSSVDAQKNAPTARDSGAIHGGAVHESAPRGPSAAPDPAAPVGRPDGNDDFKEDKKSGELKYDITKSRLPASQTWSYRTPPDQSAPAQSSVSEREGFKTPELATPAPTTPPVKTARPGISNGGAPADTPPAEEPSSRGRVRFAVEPPPAADPISMPVVPQPSAKPGEPSVVTGTAEGRYALPDIRTKKESNEELDRLRASYEHQSRLLDRVREQVEQKRDQSVAQSSRVELNDRNDELDTTVEQLQLQVRVQKETIAELEQRALSSEEMLNKIPRDVVDEALDVKKATKEAATPYELDTFVSGNITDVVDKNGTTLVQIDLGKVDGVNEGAVFRVHRGNQYLGRLTIKAVDDRSAAGSLDLVGDKKITRGDRVQSGGAAPAPNNATDFATDSDVTLPPASNFKAGPVNPWELAASDNLSTFALDVDTASYTLTRNYIRHGFLPPPAAVRMEEFINEFDYNYPGCNTGVFTVNAEAALSPFAGEGKRLTLLKVGVRGKVIGRDQRKPAHLVLVVDTSGSMARADRLPLVKYALDQLTRQLTAGDRVSLVTYGTRASLVLDSMPATEQATILQAIDALQANGPTNMLEGLEVGYRVAQRAFKPGEVNRVVLCSDGVANVGQTEADALLENVATYRKHGVTFSSVGFGHGAYNDVLMERLANGGDGQYVFVDSQEEARRVFVDGLTAALQTIARDAKIQVEFNKDRVRRYRLIGYENRAIADADFRNDSVDAGEVGSGQSSTALYELELIDTEDTAQRAGGSGSRDLGTVYVRYRNDDTDQVEEIAHRLPGDMVRPLTPQTNPRFFLAASAAQFAELLRESEHARNGNLSSVQRVLDEVTAALPLDTQARELSQLVRSAQGLPKAP